jgi:hypothetical protein
MTTADWVPIEWPAQWGAGQLSLLRDTPFNAIAFPAAPPPALAAAARAAGLEVPTLVWRAWKDVDWAQSADVLAIGDGFWPAYSWKGVADGSAGPTGEPWLDANGWLYLYARSRGCGRAVWVRSDPPKDPRTVRQAHLQLLLAEAFAYGGRRPLWLPPEFAKELAGGHSRAVEDWKRLVAIARWLEAHSAWRSWPVVAPLIILSDFSGDNEYVAGETMLLAARQQAPFWPVYAPATVEVDFQNRRAALYPDQAAPGPKLAGLLQSFARKGGLVLIGPAAAKGFAGMKALNQHPHPRFDIYSLGDGRVAVARAAFDDPWTLANDAHLLTSKRYDPARLFNGGLLHTHTASSPDGNRSLVHVINYGGESPGHEVVLQVNRPVKSARFHAIGSASPAPAKLTGNPARPEIVLPDVSVYIGVELEHAHA